MRRSIFSLAFVVLLLGAPVLTISHESQSTRVDDDILNHLVDEVIPAVYHISVKGRIVDTATGAPKSGVENFGIGTGFGVTKNGMILTKMHVVSPNFGRTLSRISAPNTFEYVNGETIEVIISLVTKAGATYSATIVGGDPSDVNDLALIQINNAVGEFPILEISDLPPRYDRVVTVGNPFNISYTVGEGIISTLERTVNGKRLMQTTALMAPGSSGGPIVRLRDHKVVGMMDSIYAVSSRSPVGLGFGTPSTILRAFLKNELLRISNQGR